MFDSPLRYPGGKGRLLQFVADLIEMNDLTGGHYVEPYAGGAGIAISLLYLEYASHIHLNDLNPSVFAFWDTVLNRADDLNRLILETPITMDEWRRQKAIQTATDPDPTELGFSTFFLNRTNRSGIINGGVIGGKAQAGVWTLDARFNKMDLQKRIEKIASFSPRISLHNLDAADFIAGPLRAVPTASLVYLDPPYYLKGSELYQNHYKHDDHAKVAALVSTIEQRWIVSYDNAEPICRLYSGFRQQTFGLRYSANARYVGAEVMIFGDSVKSPGEVIPSRRDVA